MVICFCSLRIMYMYWKHATDGIFFNFFLQSFQYKLLSVLQRKFEFLVEAVECFDKRKFLNEKTHNFNLPKKLNANLIFST